MRLLTRAFALLLTVAEAIGAQRQAGIRRHTAILPRDGGALPMALGDSLPLVAHRYRCTGDVCVLLPRARIVMWASLSPRLIVLRSGVAVPQSAGTHRLEARVGGHVVRDSIRVLPPVASIGWSAHAATLNVGDTLRVAVLARDSAGRTIGRLGVSAHIRGTGASGEMLFFDQDGYAALYVDQPGVVTLIGRLAHRVDTLRVPAVGRPRPP
jgi:hypothetical protein